MAIEPGKRFGPYEIVSEIGAGGMGVVYRATDTNLKRDVAIKVLPEALASDAERIARFDREAKTLASLNHPNIATIHGLEKSEGTTALVMELVDGSTLEERIKQGALPADEALNIAMQIAEALEAAHGQGIVHRDLKPANIKLREYGTVKVLDFGIAKALEPDTLTSEPESPMLTTPATQVGVILGTAAYMSPEQARGKPVDQRADIWAFGCVLYEMLTGQPAFAGEDIPMTLARVLDRDTDLDTLPADVSRAVRRAIKLCLEKELKERVSDIRDVRLALSGRFDTGAEQGPDTELAAAPFSRRALPLAAAVLAGGAIVGFAAWSLWPEPESPRVTRFAISQPPDRSLTPQGFNHDLVLSPDGSRLVYRALDNGQPVLVDHPLDSLEGTVLQPVLTFDLFFSPDGAWVGFIDDEGFKRVSVTGGAAIELAPLEGGFPRGAKWGADDTIIFGTSAPSELWQIPAGIGSPEPLTTLNGAETGTNHQWPELLPGGEVILFAIQPPGEGPDAARIALRNLVTGEQRELIAGGSDPRYVSTGHILYGYLGTVRAVPFDLDRLEVIGNPVPVLEGVGTTQVGAANFSVARDGTLAYMAGSLGGGAQSLVWVDRTGREEVIPAQPGAYVYPRISPDGRRVALDDRNAANDLWVWDFAGETLSRLTVGADGGQYPVWTRDGLRIAYQNGSQNGIYWKAANNTGDAELIVEDPGGDFSPYFFSPSGDEIVFQSIGGPAVNDDIGMATVGSDAEPVWLLDEPYSELNAEISPDGRWMAYSSNESSGPGDWEIYVRPFPNVDDNLWQVSNSRGEKPLWSRDGTELFYLEPGPPERLMSVSVEATDTEISFGDRTAIIDWPYRGTSTAVGRPYDVSQDGQRFLAIKTGGAGDAAPRIIVVQNWLQELNRLVPTDQR